MSLLRLNQFIIPVEADTAQVACEDVGRAGRGATGLAFKDRQYLKRRWSFKTKPMVIADLMALQDWLHGNAWVFPLNEANTSNVPASLGAANNTGLVFPSAVAADGLTVTTSAKYGSGSLSFPIATTNVWPGNVITGTDTSSNTSGFTAITTGTITSSTTQKWQGSRSLKLVTTGASQGVKTDTYSAGTGGWNATFYVNGSAVVLTCKLMQTSTVISTTTVTPSTTTWQRVFMEMAKGTTIPGAGDLHVEITAAGAGTFYLDGFQLANRVYASQWCNTTLSAGTVWNFNAAAAGVWGSARGITLSCWMTKPSIFNGCYALRAWINTSGSPEFAINTTDTFDTLGCYVNDGSTTSQLSAGIASWPTEWRHVLATWDPYAVGGSKQRIYVDGALAASSSPSVALDASTLTILNICTNNGSTAFNGNVDDCVILPYPVGPLVAAGIYAGGAAMPTTARPFITADGDAMSEGPVSVMGIMDELEFVPVIAAGSWQDNSGTATLKLVEA